MHRKLKQYHHQEKFLAAHIFQVTRDPERKKRKQASRFMFRFLLA
jgi:hypothetical protein